MPCRLIQKVYKLRQKFSFAITFHILEISSQKVVKEYLWVGTICLDLAAHKNCCDLPQNSQKDYNRFYKGWQKCEIPEIHQTRSVITGWDLYFYALTYVLQDNIMQPSNPSFMHLPSLDYKCASKRSGQSLALFAAEWLYINWRLAIVPLKNTYTPLYVYHLFYNDPKYSMLFSYKL